MKSRRAATGVFLLAMALAGVLGSLAACGTGEDASPTAVPTGAPAGSTTTADVPLGDTRWTLESYGPLDSQATVLEGSEVSARFDSGKRTVTGSAGCNTYSGSYEAGDDTLSVGPLASTEMYCMGPDPDDEDYGRGLMDQESAVLQTLGAAERYEVSDGRLRVDSSDGRRLVFAAD